MKKGAKVLLWSGIFGGAIAAVVALTKRAEAAPPPPPPPGGLTITLYDPYGNVIGTSGAVQRAVAAAPTAATEGDVISIGLGVTNTSHQILGGVSTPVAANLTVVISAIAGSIALVPSTQKVLSFGAGQSITVDKTTWSALQFTIPVGAGGKTGTVSAQLLDPNGVVLASGQVSFSIAAAPIIYGGSIIFT